MTRFRRSSVLRTVIACGLAGASAAPEAARATEECLSSGDATEAVTIHRVVAPSEAIVLAQRTVPNSDILRATLCREREPNALVYRITALRHDGKVVRVTVDAPSGKLKTVH